MYMKARQALLVGLVLQLELVGLLSDLRVDVAHVDLGVGLDEVDLGLGPPLGRLAQLLDLGDVGTEDVETVLDANAADLGSQHNVGRQGVALDTQKHANKCRVVLAGDANEVTGLYAVWVRFAHELSSPSFRVVLAVEVLLHLEHRVGALLYQARSRLVDVDNVFCG